MENLNLDKYRNLKKKKKITEEQALADELRKFLMNVPSFGMLMRIINRIGKERTYLFMSQMKDKGIHNFRYFMAMTRGIKKQ